MGTGDLNKWGLYGFHIKLTSVEFHEGGNNLQAQGMVEELAGFRFGEWLNARIKHIHHLVCVGEC